MPVEHAPIEILPAGGLLIGDRRVTDSSGGTHQHIYPATGRGTIDVAMAGPAEMEDAVASARAALPGWRTTPVNRRRDLLLRFADLLEREAKDLVRLGTTENGAAISKARIHFGASVDQFRYIAGWADKVAGEVHASWPIPGIDYVRAEPYGVIAIIIPWNAPMHIMGATLAPALAMGNTIVLKPSEFAPFTATRFGELLLEAGFPPGVVNVVPATVSASQALVRNPGIDKIHFTGSATTARSILTGALENLTPVGLELGGKSARLVFADCDLDAAIADATSAALSISGQGCLLGTRVMVEQSIYDEFVSRSVARLESAVVGDPMAADTDMGPVISQMSCERILGIIDDAASNGAGRLATGGKRLGGELSDGFFLQPTLFADVPNTSYLARTEIFGPVVSVMPFESEATAVAMANDNPFGLAGYVHTNDLRRAHRVAGSLNTGVVWVNGFCFGSSIPFGGVKQSGFGRAGGRQGLDEFSRTKTVWISQ
ncbi:acyl-CoA reductase-like NAD-dependent aldehyde dehydrogenase [Novosphingobium hassiacum]|uniref:Acyl-CoA reductase-like NAD-dependent aldehyde dehydrogenase n=1 Tax=Novosphingobium hassiacum TaxID=173676 RepID=A0A7W6EXI8_9SPHN|nr:aldehyde dehydrogenase family protein [Novosphingobium hassiacum]MBB3862336.1 acyl-CoA reductase-like NAD-dependent aldehyde dehydrogenase [Novosphingobium hassiacum]